MKFNQRVNLTFRNKSRVPFPLDRTKPSHSRSPQYIPSEIAETCYKSRLTETYPSRSRIARQSGRTPFRSGRMVVAIARARSILKIWGRSEPRQQFPLRRPISRWPTPCVSVQETNTYFAGNCLRMVGFILYFLIPLSLVILLYLSPYVCYFGNSSRQHNGVCIVRNKFNMSYRYVFR